MTFQAFTVPWLRIYVTAIYVHGDPADRASRWGSFLAGARSPMKEPALLRRWSIPLTTLAVVVGSGLAPGGASAAAHPAAHPSVRGWNPGGVMHHVSGVSPAAAGV